jgi:ribonuclease E/ribonuclease G
VSAAIDEILIGRQGDAILALGFARGRLIDIAREPSDRALAPGAIHRARAGQAAPGGVFVDLAQGTVALLDAGKPPPPGSTLIVQAIEAPSGARRARVSRRVALEGEFAILLPGGKGASVSKRVHAAKREALQARAHALIAPGEGLILRAAALDADDASLAKELAALRARKLDAEGPPALLWSEPAIPALRRALGADANAELVCADADLARAARVAHDPAAFERHDAATLLARLEEPRVDLPSGAWLSIEPTSALVAIDVNSGTAKDGALEVDLEAAREIARQLRLRDLAGLVAVDALRVVKPGERTRLLDAFKHATRGDRRRVDVLGFTTGGLVELTRARSRGSFAE